MTIVEKIGLWTIESVLRSSGSMASMFSTVSQYDRGNPSTCSATYVRIRFVEIGAT